MTTISHENLVSVKLDNITVNLPKPLNGTEPSIHRYLVYTTTVSVMATDGRLISMQKKLTMIGQIMGNTHIPNLAVRGLESNMAEQLWDPSKWKIIHFLDSKGNQIKDATVPESHGQVLKPLAPGADTNSTRPDDIKFVFLSVTLDFSKGFI